MTSRLAPRRVTQRRTAPPPSSSTPRSAVPAFPTTIHTHTTQQPRLAVHHHATLPTDGLDDQRYARTHKNQDEREDDYATCIMRDEDILMTDKTMTKKDDDDNDARGGRLRFGMNDNSRHRRQPFQRLAEGVGGQSRRYVAWAAGVAVRAGRTGHPQQGGN